MTSFFLKIIVYYPVVYLDVWLRDCCCDPIRLQ